MGFRKSALRDDGGIRHDGKRMLLIEDSRVFSTLITQAAETLHGIEVTHCASLTAVRQAVSRQTFSIAVLDLNLPDAPNCEALDCVLSYGIPAIVFTGSFNDTTRDDVLARGVVDCIIKHRPDSVTDVIASVDRTLTNHATTILVVEPDARQRGDIAATLRYKQFQVVEAETSAQALLVTDDVDVDLVICAYEASGISAGALVADLLHRHSQDALPPVIAVASAGQRAQAAPFLALGGADFLARPFRTDELNARVTLALSRQRRIQTLYRLASRDYLTDLYNRRYFFQHGPRLVDQFMRHGKGTCVAVLDIDHFKRLNDTYGHEIGDLVLKAISRNLSAYVGSDHLLARLGGEEFGILFNGFDMKAATAYCEGLRSAIAQARVVTDDEELSVTVSIGLAPVSGRETFDNYLNAADQFLYMAKHAGRNRIFSEQMMLDALAS